MKPLVAAVLCAALLDTHTGNAANQINPANPPTQSVTLGLRWRNQPELDELLHRLKQPDSPLYQRYLSAREFDDRFAPAKDDVAQVINEMAARGLAVSAVSTSGQLITVTGAAEAIEQAFGVRLATVEVNGELVVASDHDPTVPAALASMVTSVTGLDHSTQLHPNNTGPRVPPQEGSPFQPRDIAAAYNFTPLYNAGVIGDGSRAATIAIATAFGFQPADISQFWTSLGVKRGLDQVEVIPVGGNTTQTIDETTLDVEWAGAMAPGSSLLAYVGADSSLSTFTQVYDRIVSDNRAGVMTTSWGLCEQKMSNAVLDQTHAIFEKAAALGITVVAAGGDNGAFDCGTNVLGVNYPASDPMVTAIGGTTLLMANGTRIAESAWQGSGGGMSGIWQQSPWQMSVSGWRQSADVALNADPNTGYYVVNNNGWWSYGGTSVAAPIWAAVLALSNQYRARMGQPTLGLAGPALCDLAMSPPPGSPGLIDIVTGNNGHYPATSGWDFPTGWGAPDAWSFADSLATGATPQSFNRAISTVLYLMPVPPVASGTVRIEQLIRCGRTRLTTAVRGLPSGLYRLAIDDTPVVEFFIDGSGHGRSVLSGIDPRDHTVTLIDDGGNVLFRNDVPMVPAPPVRMRAVLTSTNRQPGVSGLVTYDRRAGGERVAVLVRGLRAGDYQLFAGNQSAATIQVDHDGEAAIMRFDTRAIFGSPPPVALSCRTLQVRLGTVVLLQLTATQPGTGICPGS